MSKRPSTPWLSRPFSFQPFFHYASDGGKPGKKPNKGKPDPGVTTMAVGEESGGDRPPGRTTPAQGEEGHADVPTTTIAKGEEQGG